MVKEQEGGLGDSCVVLEGREKKFENKQHSS